MYAYEVATYKNGKAMRVLVLAPDYQAALKELEESGYETEPGDIKPLNFNAIEIKLEDKK
jgi:hypothetical protein